MALALQHYQPAVRGPFVAGIFAYPKSEQFDGALDGYSLLFALALAALCVLLWLGRGRANFPDEEDEEGLPQD